MQQRAISDSFAASRIWRIEQGLNLVLVEMGDESLIGNLVGDRKNPADLVQCRWLAMLQKVEEGSDCSQAHVAGSR